MKKTKIFAAVAAVGICGAAQAVPITFEFSGTVQQVTVDVEHLAGQTATGLFVFDTDHFSLLATPPLATWTDILPFDARPAPIAASLSVGGSLLSLNADVETYGGIHFNDACQPDCLPGLAESWGISANSQSFALGAPVPANGYVTSSLTFNSRSPDYLDFFDGAGLTPESVLTLPLLQLAGNFNRWVYECHDVTSEEEARCNLVTQTTISFQVDTVTRSNGPQSVPEPATLGLLAMGLLGGALSRRRIARR